MSRASFWILGLTFCSALFAGPNCPWGSVWDGTKCQRMCPDGYEWNASGVCVKDPLVTPVRCARDDAYFASTPHGCQDLSTKLTWSAKSAQTMSGRAAEAYCNRIEANTNRWRLPLRGELRAVAGETLAALHFNFATADWFWSATVKQHWQPHWPHPSLERARVRLSDGVSDLVAVKFFHHGWERWDDRVQGSVVCVLDPQS